MVVLDSISGTTAGVVVVYATSDDVTHVARITNVACPRGCTCIVCVHGPCIHRAQSIAALEGHQAALARFREEARRARLKPRYFDGALPAGRAAVRRPGRAAAAGGRKQLEHRARSRLPNTDRRAAAVAVLRG